MTIDGFEIENWSCIRKLSVADLPETGVIVLHGPNRTGKSSLVQALRACLMDSKSDSTKVKDWFPRGTGVKPVVTVTFRQSGTVYRIRKHFGTKKSELSSRTAAGAWKVEADNATTAHEAVCNLIGGDKSTRGLQQLLWLSQAEIHLPEANAFDTGVQARLRGILGVLQTPLDDRFAERVRERWKTWHSGTRKADKVPAVKEGCDLAKNRKRLEQERAHLRDSDARFEELEKLLGRTRELEATRFDLQRQLEDQTWKCEALAEMRERSRDRIAARTLAVEKAAAAEREVTAALAHEKERSDAVDRFAKADTELTPARKAVEACNQRIETATAARETLQREFDGLKNTKRDVQKQAERVTSLRARFNLETQLTVARNEYDRVHALDEAIRVLESEIAARPAPDDAMLNALKENRKQFERWTAETKAASIRLRLQSDAGAAEANITVDGAPAPAASEVAVRRTASVGIPGWGRIEVARGSGDDDLDQIEARLRQCEREFADAVAPFGIPASDPQALDQLMRRASERTLRTAEIDAKKKDLKKVAPKGLAPLHSKIVELQTKLGDGPIESEETPETLEARDGELQLRLQQLVQEIEEREKRLKLDDNAIQNLRGQQTKARETLAACEAVLMTQRESLERFPAASEIAQRVEAAKNALATARDELTATELTAEEETIDARLSESQAGHNALQISLRECDRQYHEIQGRMTGSEGLHAERAACGARVDELARQVEREDLDRLAVDRLYELFDASRDKQLGTVVGPIHDRVLNWMRHLNLGDYGEMRFNDAFLPESLVRRDGTAEFALSEESTGAQEQISMLVRLALGSVLSPGEPTVAILDDPLTHCDVGRLQSMRSILRRAAAGDDTRTPPASPLQIIILTCHPEWFRDDNAIVIDLENAMRD